MKSSIVPLASLTKPVALIPWCIDDSYHAESFADRFDLRRANIIQGKAIIAVRETARCCFGKGDLAVVNDSDGGGRCCSARERFIEHIVFSIDSTRSMSLCGMTAFSYAPIADNSRASHSCIDAVNDLVNILKMLLSRSLKEEMTV